MTIDESALVRAMPRATQTTGWTKVLNLAMSRFEISSLERIAAFLAQVAYESAELSRLEEQLSYTAKRIMAVWPRRFPDLRSALPYERNAQGLANRVYANRLGNGNEASGDGWRYRGRGLIQITGRNNYRDAGLALGLPLEADPDLLLSEDAAAASAAWFWKSHGLNALADDRSDDDDDEDFRRITRTINGGLPGLEERRRYWVRAREALGLPRR